MSPSDENCPHPVVISSPDGATWCELCNAKVSDADEQTPEQFGEEQVRLYHDQLRNICHSWPADESIGVVAEELLSLLDDAEELRRIKAMENGGNGWKLGEVYDSQEGMWTADIDLFTRKGVHGGKIQIHGHDKAEAELIRGRIMRKMVSVRKAYRYLFLAHKYRLQGMRLGKAHRELVALVDSPHTEEWFEGVRLEAAHQVRRWGEPHDQGKTAVDWVFLIGHLATKASLAFLGGDITKAKHHTISTAAVCLNWFRCISSEAEAKQSEE